MGYSLAPQEIAFLAKVAGHEDIASIAYLIQALVNGVELSRDDLLSIEDYLMDREQELDNEGLDVPGFFASIRQIVIKLASSAPTLPSADGNSPIPGLGALAQYAPQPPNGNIQQYTQQPQQAPRKERKPRQVNPNPTPKAPRKEKYDSLEITPEAIPQYLLDIHAIVTEAVEYRLREEIRLREEAEAKLKNLREVLGVL